MSQRPILTVALFATVACTVSSAAAPLLRTYAVETGVKGVVDM